MFENAIAQTKKPWLWHIITYFSDPRVKAAHVEEIADSLKRENGATTQTITHTIDQRCRDAANWNGTEPLFERVGPATYRMIRKIDPIEEIRIGFIDHSRRVLWEEVCRENDDAWTALSNREKYERFCRLISPGGRLERRRLEYENFYGRLSLDEFL